MDKKTILGIVVVAALFLGFAYFNTKQQEKYQQEMAAYQAYQDSVAAATRPVVPVADSTAVAASDTAAPEAAANAADAVRRQQVAALGEYLAGARDAEAEEFTVENDVMIVTFSTRGGRITGVTLKDYTKYAPRGKRDQLIELMDPASARFDLSFYVKNGLNNVKVNTMDYVFRAQPEQVEGDARRVVMRLPVAADAWLEYEYLIYNKQVPERDYLVDFNVRLVNMAPQMANQASIGIDWSNNSYQNEKGFQNENMYTTISYRFPGESSIEDLGMSEKSKSKSISTSVNWVAFKQQFFSSAFIAPQNVTNANLAFDTAAPGSELLKSFSAQMTVPYTVQTEGYDFAFYFGPNKYAILKKVVAADGEELHMERLIPLGWGIFGWVNRWCVIPVFDFLRNYIASFGIIILILVILVKLVISPLTYKSYVSMAKMRLIKPQVDELNKKYPKKEDAMKSKIKKRLIAFMLCMVLVLSSAISAFADDLDTQAQDQTTTMADEPVATSMDDSTDEQQPVAEAEENQEQAVETLVELVVGPDVGFVDEYIIVVAELVVFTDQAIRIVQIVLNHAGIVTIVAHGEFVYVRVFVGTQQIFHRFVVHAFGGTDI